jgi:group I intron endonuclease
MYGFIYITTNLINGKRYIGRCSYSKTGWMSYIGSGKHMQMAIKKYGKKNFKRLIIEECQTFEDTVQAERAWIRFYGAVESRRFYNINLGSGHASLGFLGKTHTEEHKEWLRQRYTGKKRPKHVGEAVRRARTGHIKSPETIAKHRAAISGSNHVRAKAVTIAGVMYPTLTAAAKATGMNPRQVAKFVHTG